MQVYVGEFSESDLDAGIDKKAVSEAMERTGLKYTNTMFVKKRGKIVALKIWVCDFDDVKV